MILLLSSIVLWLGRGHEKAQGQGQSRSARTKGRTNHETFAIQPTAPSETHIPQHDGRHPDRRDGDTRGLSSRESRSKRPSRAQPQRKQKQNEQRGIRAGGRGGGGDYVGEGLEGADEVPVPAHPELVRLHGGEQRRRRRRFSPAAPRRATAAHLARKLREEEGGGSAELAEREVDPAAVGGVESLRCSALLPSGWGGFGMVELLLRPPPSGWSRRGLVGCDLSRRRQPGTR
jgi:hypothetical protein